MRRPVLRWLPCVLALCVAGTASGQPAGLRDAPTLLEQLGGGNLVANQAGSRLQPMYDALRGVGARLARVNTYEWRAPTGRPTPANLDEAMRQAWENRVTPVLLLEYYGSYRDLRPPQPLRAYEDWFAAGAALAERFRPNGSWARQRGIRDWGATVFTAINEPDVENTIPKQDYRDALAGLADGVHSVGPALRVVPGGFATCNSAGDATLRGYGPAIADLVNEGRLDGIDLHTYYHARWFPPTEGRRFSAQACFDAVKRAAGITRDIRFYATEFNVAKVTRDGAAMPDGEAASLFLTGLWDHLGVVGNDREHPVAALVFPWNLAETARSAESIYAMARRHTPWAGDSRAEALRTVLRLAGGMRVLRADPGRGEVHLRGEGQSLVVWHNRPGWTDRPRESFALELPSEGRQVEVWGHDGLRRRLTTDGGARVEVTDLPIGQTYMFLVR